MKFNRNIAKNISAFIKKFITRKNFWMVNEKVMSPEQNQALKSVYIVFKDLLEDVATEAKNSGVTPENMGTTFQTFFRQQYSLPKKFGPKQSVKVTKHESLSIMYVDFPDKITKILPHLSKKLEIRLAINDGHSNVEFTSNREITNQLVVRVKKMLTNMADYKVLIQHEMQHLIYSHRLEKREEFDIY